MSFVFNFNFYFHPQLGYPIQKREVPNSLWHNSLIRISTFREFRSQQFHEGHNLFANCGWKHRGDSLFARFSVL